MSEAAKGIFRTFAKFRGKHLCQSIFFNNVAGLRSATLLKKRPWYWCFPVNCAKVLIKRFLQNTSAGLLLKRLMYAQSTFTLSEDYLQIKLEKTEASTRGVL